LRLLDGTEIRIERRAFEAGYVYPDGTSFGDVKLAVLRDRSHLADEGVVVVTVAVSHQTGDIIYGPNLDSHGLTDDPSPILLKAADAVRQTVTDLASSTETDRNQLQQAIRQAAAAVIRAETSRKPVIIPVLLEL
jgi:ribonuclease J